MHFRRNAVTGSRKGLLATAYHEAGHAVVAHLLRVGFRSVTVVPNRDLGSLGHIILRDLPKGLKRRVETSKPTPQDRERIENRIIADLAGTLAERMVKKRIPRWTAERDRQEAADLVLRMCGSLEETNAYIAWLCTRAEDMSQTELFAAAVKGLAEALVERQTLTHSEAVKVIEQSIENAIREKSGQRKTNGMGPQASVG